MIPPTSSKQHSEWSTYSVCFENQQIWNDRESSDCKKVVSAFPPTTLGHFSDSPPSYELNYKQGVSFRFDIRNKEILQVLRDRQEHPTDYKGCSPTLLSLSVFPRSDEILDTSKRLFEIYPNEGVRIHKPDQTRIFIELGAGHQSLISSLGLPDSIHEDEVFNYFQYGIDVKIPRSGSNRISHIVLHTNLPGMTEFGRYQRAWFQFDQKRKKVRDGPQVQVNNMSKLPQVIDALGDPGPPIVIEDLTSSSRHFYSFPGGILMEISQAGFISSVHLSNSS